MAFKTTSAEIVKGDIARVTVGVRIGASDGQVLVAHEDPTWIRRTWSTEHEYFALSTMTRQAFALKSSVRATVVGSDLTEAGAMGAMVNLEM